MLTLGAAGRTGSSSRSSSTPATRPATAASAWPRTARDWRVCGSSRCSSSPWWRSTRRRPSSPSTPPPTPSFRSSRRAPLVFFSHLVSPYFSLSVCTSIPTASFNSPAEFFVFFYFYFFICCLWFGVTCIYLVLSCSVKLPCLNQSIETITLFCCFLWFLCLMLVLS